MSEIGQIKLQLEMAAYSEKIALAELEEAKSHERVKELQFELTRFQMRVLEETAKQMERQGGSTAKPGGST